MGHGCDGERRDESRGRGISGVVDGVWYFAGNRRLADVMTGSAATFENSTCYFGWEGAVRGGFRFGDLVRSEAVSLCWALRRRGVRTILLSGDSAESTRAVGEAIGVDEWHAEAAPAGKAEFLRELQSAGSTVAMIGDGVNDAQAWRRRI